MGVVGLHAPKDFKILAIEATKRSGVALHKWRDDYNLSQSEAVRVLDGVSNDLCLIADAAELCRNVHSDPKWIQAATDAVQQVAAFMSEANVDSKFYQRLQSAESLTSGTREERRVLHAMRVAMEHEGVHLDAASKEDLLDLQDQDTRMSFEIVQSKQSFESNRSDGIWLSTESPHLARFAYLFKSLAKRNLGTEVFLPRSHPIGGHLLRYLPDPDLRKQIWEVYSSPLCEKSAAEFAHIDTLISLRDKLAKIRGYKNWNHYAQRESVLSEIGGPVAVEKFLRDLWIALQPGLLKEINILTNLNGGVSPKPWDLDYLMNMLKSNDTHHTVTLKELITAAERLVENSLGLKMILAPAPAETWSSDVSRFELRDGDRIRAVLYLDAFAKPHKSVQSAQFTIAGSKQMADGFQLPRTAMVLSFNVSSENDPIPASQAITFFHELGHVLHSLLSNTQLQHFSGARGPIDFVEFHSHLFEHFCTDHHALSLIFKVPLNEARSFAKSCKPTFGHIEAAQQLVYALMDQVYYATGSPFNLADHLPRVPGIDNAELVALLSPPSPIHFDHLIHYGGNYYCYLLCRALSADVWRRAFSGGRWQLHEHGSRILFFLERGSVDQSLKVISELSGGNMEISFDAMMADLGEANLAAAAA